MNSSNPVKNSLSLCKRSNFKHLLKEVADFIIPEEVDLNTCNDENDDDTSDKDEDIDDFNENFNIYGEVDYD